MSVRSLRSPRVAIPSTDPTSVLVQEVLDEPGSPAIEISEFPSVFLRRYILKDVEFRSLSLCIQFQEKTSGPTPVPVSNGL